MSGIGAIFHRDGRPVKREQIERVTRSLKMYGPERQTMRLMGAVAFAYTHFINTPEARFDDQPITGGGGRYTFLFDGRLDNRAELAESLGIATKDLPTMPDSVMALRSWEKWQTGALNKWVGEFAVIVWDKTERRLIAAKEQFGRRGLHYHLSDDRIVIATMPKGIHALGDVPREVDEQKIADTLVWMAGEPERGFYKHLKRVPPAHFLVVDDANARVEEYYRLDDAVKDVRYANDDDYVEAAREHLERSVKAALRSPGGVGAFMSGGLDSSTVAVTASKFLERDGKRLPTFTWVPEAGWDGITSARHYGDETPFVKAIGEMHPNLELNFVSAEGRSYDYLQRQLFEAAEEPIYGMNIPLGLASVERAKSKGIEVILAGEFGNLTLSNKGLGVYFELWRRGKFLSLYNELRHCSIGPTSFLKNFRDYVARPMGATSRLLNLTRADAGNSRQQWLRQVSAIHPDFARSMQVDHRAQKIERQKECRGVDNTPQAKWMWLLMEHASPEAGGLTAAWQALHGMDVRDPFANRRIVEWSLGLPETQYCRDGVRRWLIKRLMQDQLPRSVLYNQKIGLQSPDWHMRLSRDQSKLQAQIRTISEDRVTSRIIDSELLGARMSHLHEKPSMSDKHHLRGLQLAVSSAMGTGNFVRWVRRANN